MMKFNCRSDAPRPRGQTAISGLRHEDKSQSAKPNDDSMSEECAKKKKKKVARSDDIIYKVRSNFLQGRFICVGIRRCLPVMQEKESGVAERPPLDRVATRPF